MKNANHPPRRCSLTFYWNTHPDRVESHYIHAHSVMDVLVAGGLSEGDAKCAVEQIWKSGYSEGYDEAAFNYESQN